MNTTLQSADPLQSIRPAPAIARRSPVAGVTDSDIYGGERLPVLVRLPDLTRAAILPLPAVLESTSGEAACSQCDPPPPAEPVQEQQPDRRPTRQLRQQRRVRTVTRPHAGSETAGWLRGLGQLAMAAVLAGVLLVVVITIKHWNADSAKSQPAVGVPLAETPEFDFSGPVLEPAVNTQAEQGSSLGLPAMGSQGGTLRGVLPAEISSSSFSGGVQPAGGITIDSSLTRGGAAALEVPRATAFASPVTPMYPSTGVAEPVTISPRTASPGAVTAGQAAGWSETISVGSERNAARPLVGPASERR